MLKKALKTKCTWKKGEKSVYPVILTLVKKLTVTKKKNISVTVGGGDRLAHGKKIRRGLV